MVKQNRIKSGSADTIPRIFNLNK